MLLLEVAGIMVVRCRLPRWAMLITYNSVTAWTNKWKNEQVHYTGLCQISWFPSCTDLAVTANSSSALWTGLVKTGPKLIKAPVIHPLLDCAFTAPLDALTPWVATTCARLGWVAIFYQPVTSICNDCRDAVELGCLTLLSWLLQFPKTTLESKVSRL